MIFLDNANESRVNKKEGTGENQTSLQSSPLNQNNSKNKPTQKQINESKEVLKSCSDEMKYGLFVTSPADSEVIRRGSN